MINRKKVIHFFVNTMFENIVIVAGHPRSGTHLVIDTIRLNFKKSDFPLIRPSFSTIENLILPHDGKVLDLWIKWLENCSSNNLIPVIKTHCLPSDIQSYLKIMNHKKEADLIVNILEAGKFIYIKRDPLESLKSWFEFAKGGGVVQANAGKKRLEEISFSEFLRIENLYKLPFRNWSDIDMNVVNYIAFHHTEWESFIKNKKGVYLNFSDFQKNFDFASNKLFDYLNLENINKSSEIDINKKYKNPFTKEKQNKIYKFKIGLFSKLVRVLNRISPNFSNKFRIKSRVPPRKKLFLGIKDSDILHLRNTYDESVLKYKKELML